MPRHTARIHKRHAPPNGDSLGWRGAHSLTRTRIGHILVQSPPSEQGDLNRGARGAHAQASTHQARSLEPRSARAIEQRSSVSICLASVSPFGAFSSADECERVQASAKECERARTSANDKERARTSAKECEGVRALAIERESANERERARTSANERERARTSANECERVRPSATERERARTNAKE